MSTVQNRSRQTEKKIDWLYQWTLPPLCLPTAWRPTPRAMEMQCVLHYHRFYYHDYYFYWSQSYCNTIAKHKLYIKAPGHRHTIKVTNSQQQTKQSASTQRRRVVVVVARRSPAAGSGVAKNVNCGASPSLPFPLLFSLPFSFLSPSIFLIFLFPRPFL